MPAPDARPKPRPLDRREKRALVRLRFRAYRQQSPSRPKGVSARAMTGLRAAKLAGRDHGFDRPTSAGRSLADNLMTRHDGVRGLERP